MKKIGLLLLLLTLSCNPMKRMQRLAEKHDAIFRDTIVISDTTFVPRIQLDSIFTYEIWNETDTIVIEKDKVRTQIIKKIDSFYVETICYEDTMIKYIKVPYEKVVIKNQKTPWKRYLGFLIIGFIIGLLIRNKKNW